jgi:hypothetical protein
VRALCGMKLTGARFRDYLAASLRDMGYKSCKVDPDVWVKAATKADGTKFYSFALAYVDNILCLDTNLKQVMDALSELHKLKDGSAVKAPDVNLRVVFQDTRIRRAGKDQMGLVLIQVCGRSCQGHQNS